MNHIVPDEYTNPRLVAKNLGVVKMAAIAGKRNLPATNSSVPGANEQQIGHYHNTFKAQADQRLLDSLEEISDHQNQILRQIETENIESFYKTAEYDTARLESVHIPLLRWVNKLKHEIAMEFKLFKDKHKLWRAPVQPSSLIWHYALASFFILIETIPNGVILAEGLPGGLLAGLVQALTISAISVILSFATGQAMRGLFHTNRWHQALTALLGLVYLGALLTYHLTVAHLRMAIISDPGENAYTVAILRMLNMPFSITSFDGYMLIIVGISFGIAALIAGMKTKDLFPGYSDKYKRLEEAQDRSHNLVIQYLDVLGRSLENHLAAPRGWFDEIHHLVHAYREGVDEKHRLINRYIRTIEEINESYVYCVLLYRHQNEAFRTDDPPAYFSNKQTSKRFEANVLLEPIYKQVEKEEQIALSLDKKKGEIREEVVGVQGQIFELHQFAMNQTINTFTDSILKGKPEAVA